MSGAGIGGNELGGDDYASIPSVPGTLDSTQGEGYGTKDSNTSDSRFDIKPGALSATERSYDTLGGGSSQTLLDRSDMSSTTYGMSSGRDPSDGQGTGDDRDESMATRGEGGPTTANRLPNQFDTDSGPSGGIAQGGRPQGLNVTGSIRPEHETDKTGVTSMHSNDPKFDIEHPSSANDTSLPGGGQSRRPAGGIGVVEPSVSADPSSGQQPEENRQGADRPQEAPSDGGLQAVREKKEATDRVVEGKEPGGSSMVGGGEETVKTQPGGPHTGGGKMGSEPTEKGTGQKWVKSTGMAAHGGDFDASKPGAGREADRTWKLIFAEHLSSSYTPRLLLASTPLLLSMYSITNRSIFLYFYTPQPPSSPSHLLHLLFVIVVVVLFQGPFSQHSSLAFPSSYQRPFSSQTLIAYNMPMYLQI